MKTLTTIKKLSMTAAGATFVALGVTFAHTTAANAAIVALDDKYLSKINYTHLTPPCLLPFAFCLSSLGNLFCTTT
ncbi:hypothetical protein PN482_10555 [Microcystis aeruginosa CS-555/01A07]|uniref:hypothetical protein n=1 Tax=Microcystis aeruginosa TaxID=1126 RepID=UPI0023311A6D|nr:hypothetical protein [Microcystis aeruginosa]MDB9429319.1 hypothetical protein [Microcystis aeruginosa CS-555/01A07]